MAARTSVAVLIVCSLLMALAGCSPMRPASDLARNHSTAITDPAETRIGAALAIDSRQYPGQSAFRLLDSGMEAFLLRIAMSEVAERTLDVQYYIYEDDKTGRLVTDSLLRAADRGVRVRILLDDLNLTAASDLVTLNAHPNVEVRSFNPFSWRGNMALRFASGLKQGYRLNRRMHNKSFIVDNTLAIVGGRNIADEYFAASPLRDFNDMDIAAAGPIAHEISASFDNYWNSDFAYPLAHLDLFASPAAMSDLRHKLREHLERMASSGYAKALRETQLAQQLFDRSFDFIWAEAELVVDPPEKVVTGLDRDRYHPMKAIFRHARAADDEFLVMSPYFIPAKEGVALFRKLRERGIAVRVLTNSMAATDVAAVFGGYAPYRRELLELGVEMYELKPDGAPPSADEEPLFGSSLASLHTKAFTVDRETVTIASLNMDPRSVNLNTELALVVHSHALAKRVVDRFLSAIQPANSYQLELTDSGDIVWRDQRQRWTHDPEVGPWRRFFVRVLSWLPIEGQL